jgi:hypothetical protein
MTQQEQAYIEGFVKRAAEYGFNEAEAINFLKQAAGEMPMAGKPKAPAPKVPSAIKGNANDVANPPKKPLVPMPADEQF